MAQRKIKPFKISKEKIEDYQFTKKQIAAYESLAKAVKRCNDSGLSLFGLQHDLTAIPTKFYMNEMTTPNHHDSKINRALVPYLAHITIADSGADDPHYFKDEYIK